MSERDTQYTEFQVKYTREKIESIAHKLRRLAEEVEREAAKLDSPGKAPSAVSNVMHSVTWGVANLNLDILVDNLVRIQEAVLAEAQDDA